MLLQLLITVSLPVLEILVNMSPLVNIDTIRDSNLQSPLHLACKRKDNFENSTAIATLLIDHGCDVNNAICDNDGMLPLHYGELIHSWCFAQRRVFQQDLQSFCLQLCYQEMWIV